MSSPSLSLVLPTLDEVEPLGALLPRLFGDVPELGEVIVVDDGSTDGTRRLVAAAAEDDPRITLLAREAPPSLTRSLALGLARARLPLVGWMDADGTMSTADLRRLVAAVNAGATLAIGSRFAPGGRIKGQVQDGLVGRLAALRHVAATRDAPMAVLGSWLLNVAALPVVLGDLRGAHDYTSGFVVGHREALSSLPLHGEHGEYFIGLFLEARARGYEIVEVPYAARPRFEGNAKTVARPLDYFTRGVGYLSAARAAKRRGEGS